MKMNELNRQLKKASVITKVLNSSNDPDNNLDLNKTAMLFKFHEYYKNVSQLTFDDAYDMVNAIGKMDDYDLKEYIDMHSHEALETIAFDPFPADLPEMLLLFTNQTAHNWMMDTEEYTSEYKHFINHFVLLDPRVVSHSYIYKENGDFYHLRDEEWVEIYTDLEYFNGGRFYISKEDYTDIMDNKIDDYPQPMIRAYDNYVGSLPLTEQVQS